MRVYLVAVKVEWMGSFIEVIQEEANISANIDKRRYTPPYVPREWNRQAESAY